MSKNKSRAILRLLKPFNNSAIPITKTALRYLDSSDLGDRFYEFLKNVPVKTKNDVCRPECPVKEIGHASLARRPYKQGMVKYIAQWGYEFETPAVNITPSFLEAIANRLEKA